MGSLRVADGVGTPASRSGLVVRPDVPGRVASVGPPWLRDLPHLRSRQLLAVVVQRLDPASNRQIPQRKHVLASEREHEVHPRGPLADAGDRREFGDDLLVGQRRQSIPREVPFVERGRDRSEISDLRPAQSRLPQPTLVRREHAIGRDVVVEHGVDPLTDRGRGGRRELLADHRPAEASEFVVRRRDGEPSVLVDQRRHRRIRTKHRLDFIARLDFIVHSDLVSVSVG